MLRTKVKASAIANLTDARYFAAFEVTWLGFQLDPGHEQSVTLQTAKAIREWVDGVGIVGEFGLQSAEEIRTAAELLQLDAIQAGMQTPVETLIELQTDLPVIKEIVIEKTTAAAGLEEMLEQFAPYSAFYLLNFDKNGLQWRELKTNKYGIGRKVLDSLCERYQILLSIDLQADDLAEVLNISGLAGLSFTGGEEEKVGYKSFDELDELLEALVVEV